MTAETESFSEFFFWFAFVQHVACELCEAALDPDGYGAGADESFACLLGSTSFDIPFDCRNHRFAEIEKLKIHLLSRSCSKILRFSWRSRQTVWDF